MSTKYPDLWTLMEAEPTARRYFETLPDYVRDQMSARADSVNSFESLKDYAQNLTRGDN